MAEIGWRKMEKPISGTHHATGTPGTILTWFPWPAAAGGHMGSGQVTVTSFRVPEQSVKLWESRGEKTFLSLLIPMDSSWSWLLASGIGSRMHGAEQN